MTKTPPSLKAASEIKDDDSITKSVPTFFVDPRIIKIIPGFNARPIDPDHVAHLKQLKKDGVDTGFYTLQMINGEPHIIDGHHRHAADMELIAEGVDILRVKALEFRGDEKKAILFMLATGSNKKYEPLQVGEQYTKLVNLYGMSFSEIAKERGMTAQHVKDMIRLTEQPAELKEMINNGTVKAATALKLVKKEGATEAVKTLREGVIAAPKGKGITQKVIDNLGKSVLAEADKRRVAAGEHIEAMLDSPGFDGPTKKVLKDALSIVAGKAQRIPPRSKAEDLAAVQAWLDAAKSNAHSDVVRAAHLLHDVANGKAIPADNSPGAQAYGHMVWLQDMAATTKEPTFRAAAHWFLAVLNAKRTGSEMAPAPSVLPLEEALRAEMESGGHVLAETLCPEQAALIAWMRGRP